MFKHCIAVCISAGLALGSVAATPTAAHAKTALQKKHEAKGKAAKEKSKAKSDARRAASKAKSEGKKR